MTEPRPPEERLRAAGGTVIRLRKPYPIPLTWFADIEAATETADFVQGLLVEKTLGVVFGESNSGKTLWATDLSLCVAAGIAWNGRRVERGGVIYCCLEGGHGFRNRIVAWRHEHGLEGHDLPFAAITSAINLLDPAADVEKLIATIQAVARDLTIPVRLIVIDTLSRALAGGNENAPDDMGALVRNTDRIRAETDAAVLFIHHSGKNQALGARGHSLLRAALDTEIEVTDSDGERTATVTKQRDLPGADVFSFSLRVVELGTNRFGEPITTCVVEHGETRGAGQRKERGPSGDGRRALDLLRDLIAESGALGAAGVPAGRPSVPEQWWRDRFYDRAKPGAEIKAKQKAFRRAADTLIEGHFVGFAAKHVWLSQRETS